MPQSISRHILPCLLSIASVTTLPTIVTLAVLSYIALARPADAQGTLVAHTTSGLVRGVARSGGGAQFLGIPYAQPPVGSLRWHEPLPAKPWTGVRDALAYGSSCAQPDLGLWNHAAAERSSEDCLYLNITTPSWPPAKSLPVIVWIHGGGFMGGTGSDAFSNDGTLAGHGVVLVTINYRLGIFGFFAHRELSHEAAHHESGNYGLMDQIAALRWVVNNIARFGGDPKNITIAGQSAGAASVSLLMVSSAKGLFQKAITESGSALLMSSPLLAVAEQSGVRFAEVMKAPAGDGQIAYLRTISAKDLITAASAQDPQHRPQLAPDIDGWVIASRPTEIFSRGQQAEVPLLTGTNSREMGRGSSADQLRTSIHAETGAVAPQVLALYGLADGGTGSPDSVYGPVADQFSADWRFRCPATTQAAWQVAAHQPVYVYQFDRPIPGHESDGARHSAELPYVLGVFHNNVYPDNYGPVDYQLGDEIETYWTNFARTGDPNSAGLPLWPSFGATQHYIEFTTDGKTVASAAPQRLAQCELYRKAVTQQIIP